MYSEFRKDPVSNEWILIAPGRLRYYAKKSKGFYLSRRVPRVRTPKSRCKFENPFKSISEKIILGYGRHYDGDPRAFPKSDNRWEILVLENRYPVVRHGGRKTTRKKIGVYEKLNGVGHADIILTRGHDDNFSRLDEWAAHTVFRAFRDRYRMLAKEPSVKYALAFHNWGSSAGASIYHPHYQVIGVPIIPPDIARNLEGSSLYFKKHKRCIHCSMIEEERKARRRIVFENDGAVAFAPFFSKNPFEIRVFPKNHFSNLERTPEQILCRVSLALQKVLSLIEKKLGSPDYNFFIHSAPLRDGKKYTHYHWPIEVYPKLGTRAGFEFGTGIDVNSFEPEFVAKILKAR